MEQQGEVFYQARFGNAKIQLPPLVGQNFFDRKIAFSLIVRSYPCPVIFRKHNENNS
jgi:hypothetical protein